MKKLLLFAAVCTLHSCATISEKPTTQKPGYVDHVVLMWMKNPTNQGQREQLVAAVERLRKIAVIDEIAHGKALASERPVVDDSFDLGLLVRFPDAAALHSYEIDPLHQKEVKDVLRPLTRKIQVYDIVR